MRVIVGADQPFGLCIEVIEGTVCLCSGLIGAADSRGEIGCAAFSYSARLRGEATGGEVERLGS